MMFPGFIYRQDGFRTVFAINNFTLYNTLSQIIMNLYGNTIYKIRNMGGT